MCQEWESERGEGKIRLIGREGIEEEEERVNRKVMEKKSQFRVYHIKDMYMYMCMCTLFDVVDKFCVSHKI